MNKQPTEIERMLAEHLGAKPTTPAQWANFRDYNEATLRFASLVARETAKRCAVCALVGIYGYAAEEARTMVDGILSGAIEEPRWSEVRAILRVVDGV